MENKQQNAFTLIELSIVVVVISLIVAGVVAGQSLVKQASLRAGIKEFKNFSLAYNTFYLKYNSIPGDMTNAFDFWGTIASCTDNDVSTTSGGCNGNGDGVVGRKQAHIGIYTYVQKEEYKAWQFLSLDGLINGSFDGDTNSNYKNNKNIPASSFNRIAGISFTHLPKYSRFLSDASLDDTGITIDKNFLIAATDNLLSFQGSILSTRDSFSIDSKIDDGLPQTGNVIGFSGKPNFGITVTDHCALTSSASNAYILTHDAIACALLYQLDK